MRRVHDGERDGRGVHAGERELNQELPLGLPLEQERWGNQYA